MKTPGFETPAHTIPKYHDKQKLVDSIEEIQGTPELRLASRIAGKYSPFALSPEELRKRRHVNINQYYIFQIKRLSHVFGLKGRVVLPNGKDINLEGFCEDFTIPMISSSFKSFCKTRYASLPWLSSDNQKWMQKKLLKLLTNDTVQKKDLESIVNQIKSDGFKGPIAGGSGYDWHSTITGFIGNIAFICNRGEGVHKHGVALYSFKDKTLLIKEVIKEISTRQNFDKATYFGHKAMVGELQAKQTMIIPMPEQESGNCTYRSVEAYLFTLMAFCYLKSLEPTAFYKNLENTAFLQRAFEEVRPAFNEWLHHDRILVLNDLEASLLHACQKEEKLYTLLKQKVQSSAVYLDMQLIDF